MDFHTSLLMICTSFVICCCFPQVAEAAPRPTDPFEIQALRTIYQKLGKRDWNFSADPCSGEGGGRSSDSQNYVNCNCTRNDGKYCRVTHIILKSQNLEGVLPPELTSLKYLEEIDLRSNYITGSIPEQLGSLPYLLNLNLSANHLSGQIPKKLGNLTRLVSLLIASNKFSGSLPPELGKLATLKELDVSTNSFNGRIPSSFANLIELQEFRTSSNNFIGNIPSYIGSWKNLKKLMIQGTSLEGPIPFISSSSLSDLRISDIALQGGSSLQFLQNLINLKILVLRNNLICGEIPKYLQNLRKLEILDLSFNNLTGQVPIFLNDLIHLKHLFLGNNSLTGQFPSWLGQTVVAVDLSYNNFSGQLPMWQSYQKSVNLIGNFLTSPTSDSTTCLQRSFPCLRDASYHYLAINCGGQKLTTFDKNVFEEDDDILGASRFYMSPKKNWAVNNIGHFLDADKPDQYINTTNSKFTSVGDPQLYSSARLSPISLRYYGLGLRNGSYTVELDFAEIQFSDTKNLGVRVFDAYIQGQKVLQDFNIKEEAGGKNEVVAKKFTANVTENFLEIHFFWAGKGTCCIPVKGTYGPLVSAIRVTAEEKNMEANSFSLRKMKIATNDFHPKNKIGEGGFGAVYKIYVNPP